MMEQYREQYREEMLQIHAPLDLIEKTRAAMREEENRLSRERAASVRRWGYPLTAAAALFILVSVSLTMRNMKGSSSEMDGAVYEESAEAGFAEDMAMESAVEESMAEKSAGAQDMAEEPAAGQEADMEASTGQDVAAEASAGEEEMFTESAAGAVEPVNSVETPALNETECSMEDVGQSMAADDVAGNIEDARAEKESMEQKQEATAGSFADSAADGIVIEKVEKKPAFCDLTDTKAHTYKGKTFLVRKEKDVWEAYVETENGIGYVLRGEAEGLEEFLEAGYEKLADIW